MKLILYKPTSNYLKTKWPPKLASIPSPPRRAKPSGSSVSRPRATRTHRPSSTRLTAKRSRSSPMMTQRCTHR